MSAALDGTDELITAMSISNKFGQGVTPQRVGKIAAHLGLGEHQTTYALCEAAGWP